ncbi:MAG TPA: SdiA-regulated domain-containing protein [Candidatus Limnocylindrales bacterium]|nr:SdiA-regulated domain-containing protein [Candidatus Limnocylindrales bacterium]
MAYKPALEGILEQRTAGGNDANGGPSLMHAGHAGRRTLLARAALLALLLPAIAAFRLGTPDPTVTEWPLPEFSEPSSVVYHPLRKSLFIVGDEGDIGEVSLEGKLLRKSHLGGDLEGVTVDPATGLLYVAREGHEIVFEVTADDFRITRRYTIDRTFEGNPNFLARGGDGIEGITFVPDESAKEGGRFYAANQYDPPVLIELAIPIRSTKDKFENARIVSSRAVEAPPLSDVIWQPAMKAFLVVSALWKKVYVVDAQGRNLRAARVPGLMPEGLTPLPDGRFVIAQDTGGLLLWAPPTDPFAGETAQPAAPSAQ